MSEILFDAFHDELEKLAGAKRLLRLRRTAHKSEGHLDAYLRARLKYDERMRRFGVPEGLRTAPKAAPTVAGSTVAGGALGLASGLGPLGATLGAAAGNALGVTAAAVRGRRFRQRGDLASQKYLKRVVASDLGPSPIAERVAERALRAGSPKDIPSSLALLRKNSERPPRSPRRLGGMSKVSHNCRGSILRAFKAEGGALSMSVLLKRTKRQPVYQVRKELAKMKREGLVKTHPHGDLFTVAGKLG